MSEYDKDSQTVQRRTKVTGTTPRRSWSRPQLSAVLYFGLAAEPELWPPPPPDPPIVAPPPIVAEAFPLWLAGADCAPAEAPFPPAAKPARKTSSRSVPTMPAAA